MDTTIQSLTQSSIVQTLSEKEHHIKRFVHDIEDNAPYRSQSKVSVPPSTGDNNNPNSDLTFRVSRRGYLNRMYLKASLFFSNPPLRGFGDSRGSQRDNKPLGPEFFASWFTSASIQIGGKIIETIYPENILLKAFQLKNPIAENVFYGLKGRLTSFGEDDAGDGAFDMDARTVTSNIGSYGYFLIPLDFSCMQFHKDALDTNFIAPIEIILRKRAIRGWQTEGVGSFTRCQLVCKYHNLHNHWRNQIRNTNFSKDTTSLITHDSYLLPDEGVKEQVAAVAQQVSPYVPGHDAFGRTTFKLDHLDFFLTDILITFRKATAIAIDDNLGDINRVPGRQGFLRFKLMANDNVIFEKNHYEMKAQHMNKSNLDIQDASEFAYGTKLFGSERSDERAWTADSIDFPPLSTNDFQRGFGFGVSLYRIPLSLFSTDEFQAGGLYLNALTNVKLIIEGEALLPEASTDDFRGMVPQVILKHRNMTRVDTKTGVFTTQ